MKKRAALFTILILVVIFGFSAARDIMIKKTIESAVSVATDLKVTIKTLKTSVPGTYISIKDLYILNPDSFDDRIMLVAPEIYVDFDFPAFFRKQVHLYDVRINLKELTIIKTDGGGTNLDYIKNLRRKEKGAVKQKKSPARTNLLIDQLALKVGKVVYKDYSGGGKPDVSEYNININAKYKGLTDGDEIIRTVIGRSIMNTAIEHLLDVRKFKDSTLGTIENGKDILKKTGEELRDVLKSPF